MGHALQWPQDKYDNNTFHHRSQLDVPFSGSFRGGVGIEGLQNFLTQMGRDLQGPHRAATLWDSHHQLIGAPEVGKTQ
jgi:hypothetical protein